MAFGSPKEYRYTSTGGVFGDRWASRIQPSLVASAAWAAADAAGPAAASRPAARVTRPASAVRRRNRRRPDACTVDAADGKRGLPGWNVIGISLRQLRAPS